MFRSSISPRLVVGFTLAATLGAGIGLGVVGLGSASGTAPAPARQTLTVAASTAGASTTPAPAPAPAAPSAPTPLTIDQAKAVALQASPGTVVEVKQENADNGNTEAADPTEANDPAEANDPTEANDPAEPTGLTYDVTVQHQDGSATKVVVDGTTGRVVSTEAEDAGN
jgi:hypothetical protein